MDFLEKLDFLMKRYGLNKRTLSQNSDIPYTTIDNWYKRGYEGLKLPTLKKIAEYFNTTLDYWVLDDVTDPNYGKASGFKVDYDEMEHVKKYRSLDTHGKKVVDYILDMEQERCQELQQAWEPLPTSATTTPKVIPMRRIPYYHRLASAGTGEYLFDDIPVDTVEVPTTHNLDMADYAVGVNGDSMETLFYDGDILLIHKQSNLEEGEIGVFLMNGESYVKKLGHGVLISLNKEYPDLVMNESTRCVGKVLCCIDEVVDEAKIYSQCNVPVSTEPEAGEVTTYNWAAENGTRTQEAIDGIEKIKEVFEKLTNGHKNK